MPPRMPQRGEGESRGLGCHGQRMLRRDPASFSPSDLPSPIGLVTTEDVVITFDEPGTIESGQVVYRVDGTRASMSLDDIDHLVLVQRHST